MSHNISGVIKSIQKIMRNDRGLNGDAQRIEQLGWMIFLKIFDDKDLEIELIKDDYISPIPSNLQWRNWAKDDEGITGDELLDFIDNKLFTTLKNLPTAATSNWELWEAIQSMKAAGYPHSTIAEDLNVSASTVSKYAKISK